ncbi:histidine kinase [Spirillospora sp. NPDC029432]|uniref:sensor histidine kinase n=1 Tax=Spirillospora sp. NPDC029432 TaxID=3154599 RepID=UPI0034563525
MRLRRLFLVREASIAVLAAALGLLVLEGARQTYPDPGEAHLVRDLVIGAIACTVLVAFRRRWPVRICLVLTAAGLFASSAWGATAMAVFTVAVNRGWRATAAVTALNLSIITVTFLVVPSLSRQERIESMIVFPLGYAVLISTGLLIRSRRQLIESLEERARQAEEGQRLRVEEARHLERERIAREMHDVLAHRISLLAVHAGALEFHADAPADQREAAGVIRRSAYEAMEDLREVLGLLRGPPPGPGEPGGEGTEGTEGAERPQPTLADVPSLVQESRRTGAHVTLDDRVPEPGAVPSRIGRHAYRIVQEGLTNARKHAPGARVHVAIGPAEGGGLDIEITNPLPPGPARALDLPGAGAGLLGLRERVDILGGTLDHGRTGDGRFRLHARLPPPPDPADAP